MRNYILIIFFAATCLYSGNAIKDNFHIIYEDGYGGELIVDSTKLTSSPHMVIVKDSANDTLKSYPLDSIQSGVPELHAPTHYPDSYDEIYNQKTDDTSDVDFDTIHSNCLLVGDTTDAENRYIKVLSDQNNSAGLEAYGVGEWGLGLGYLYVGANHRAGGGIFYSGNGTPPFASGESDNHVMYYRRTGAVNHVVFYYSGTSNTVRFNGTIHLNTANVTGSESATSDSTLVPLMDLVDSIGTKSDTAHNHGVGTSGRYPIYQANGEDFEDGNIRDSVDTTRIRDGFRVASNGIACAYTGVRTSFLGQTGDVSQITGVGYLNWGDSIQVGDSLYVRSGADEVKISHQSGIHMIGEATQWDDIAFSISGQRLPAANAPTRFDLTPSGNIDAYQFDLNDKISLDCSEILHGFYEASDSIEFHLHYVAVNTSDDATDTYVSARLYYTIWSSGDTLAENFISAEDTIPSALTASRVGLYLELGKIATADILKGDQICLAIERTGTIGTDPANDPLFIDIGVHIEIESFGSDDEVP